MFLYLYVIYLCVLKEAKRGCEVSLELELQVIINSPTWVLRVNVERAACSY